MCHFGECEQILGGLGQYSVNVEKGFVNVEGPVLGQYWVSKTDKETNTVDQKHLLEEVVSVLRRVK